MTIHHRILLTIKIALHHDLLLLGEKGLIEFRGQHYLC